MLITCQVARFAFAIGIRSDAGLRLRIDLLVFNLCLGLFCSALDYLIASVIGFSGIVMEIRGILKQI